MDYHHRLTHLKFRKSGDFLSEVKEAFYEVFSRRNSNTSVVLQFMFFAT